MNNSELRLDQHEQAVKLHQEIMVSASLAQQNIWTMCTKLKEMRDGKLYKELGYQNFEDYCENEVGMKRRNVYNYISIVEKINAENVQPVAQIGVKKLSLLATLSSEQQSDIAEKVDLETTTYKELKAEIDKLKQDNSKLDAKLKAETANAEEARSDLKDVQSKLRIEINKACSERDRANKALEKLDGKEREITRLERENKELRSRPTEVAVIDRPIDDDNPQLKEAIRILERENMKRNEEMDRQYLQDRRELEARKQAEINALREEYEKKLAESVKGAEPSPEPIDADKLKFKVYLTAAFDSLKRLTDFTQKNQDDTYKEKIKQLLNSVLAELED